MAALLAQMLHIAAHIQRLVDIQGNVLKFLKKQVRRFSVWSSTSLKFLPECRVETDVAPEENFGNVENVLCMTSHLED